MFELGIRIISGRSMHFKQAIKIRLSSYEAFRYVVSFIDTLFYCINENETKKYNELMTSLKIRYGERCLYLKHRHILLWLGF